jgi:hypothetical protein
MPGLVGIARCIDGIRERLIFVVDRPVEPHHPLPASIVLADVKLHYVHCAMSLIRHSHRLVALRLGSSAFGQKTGDTILIEGVLPSREFFVRKHVTVVGFGATESPAANRDHDRRFIQSAPSSPTGWRKIAFEIKGARFGRAD